MFTQTIDPVLLSLGPLEIRYYGIVYALGLLFSWWILEKNKEKIDFNSKQTNDFIFWIAVGMIVGARLFEVLIWEPGYYFANPAKILAVWRGGLSFHGGLAGMLFAGWWYCRKHKKNYLAVADLFILPALLFAAIGRLANLVNNEIVGTVSNLPWCFNFPNYQGCRHPYQIYSFLKRLVIVGVLTLMYKRPHKDGFIFWMSVLFVSIGRFLLDFVREDVRYYLGLSVGQYLCVVFAIVAVFVLMNYKEDLKGIFRKS